MHGDQTRDVSMPSKLQASCKCKLQASKVAGSTSACYIEDRREENDEETHASQPTTALGEGSTRQLALGG